MNRDHRNNGMDRERAVNTTTEKIEENDPFRILCLDGGGIRGAFVAAFLSEIEEHLEFPLWRYFDLIAGTSTGGIIALCLAMGEPASRVCDLF